MRLLLSVGHAFREGDLLIDVGSHRERLLSIKHGEWPYERIVDWAKKLREEADRSFQTTSLPAEPDYVFADAILRWARRRAAGLAGDDPPPDLKVLLT